MALSISLAQWSLHRSIRSGKVLPLEFPSVARREFGIDAIELVSTLQGRWRLESLRELRRRADAEGVRTLLIMVDDEGDLSHARRRVRKKAVANHLRWLEAAEILGSNAIRVNTGGPQPRAWSTPASDPSLRDAIERCAESVEALAAQALPAGVDILLENHGGISSSIPSLNRVVERVAGQNVGTLPDFGNFSAGADPYAAVEEMLPLARAVSAKTFDFDDAGNETTIDYPRMLELVRRSGYEGHLGIEYEGGRLPEAEGIRLSKALLERNLAR